MDAFVVWLQSTSLSHAIVFSTWIWPAAETVHFIGLALVLGIVGVLDLRLMGFFPAVPIAAYREIVPFALVGFALNVLSGVIFLIGHPEQYVHNISWWMKVGSLFIAGANAAVFEATVARQAMVLPAGAPTTSAMKFFGALSLIAWLGVLYWGRMLPFIGDAY